MRKEINRRGFLRATALASLGFGLTSSSLPQRDLPISNKQQPGKRVGIIGLDTSHAVAFTKSLNADQPESRYLQYRVVAAYPQGSKDILSATERVPQYIEEVKKLGVEIVDSIQALLDKVDVILLESNDGRVHLEQARPVIEAKKTLFIDKPIAASYDDAKAIFDLAAQHDVSVFSSSSLRFVDKVQEIRSGSIGKVLGADTYSPAHLEETHPDFFWYGIHGVEMLFTVMGTGCQSVSRTHTEGTDVVVGQWADGRIGTFRGTRVGKSDYGGNAFGEKGNSTLGQFKGYDALLAEIIQFFDTGIVPVPKEETLEICAFIEAADESKRQGGKSIELIKN
ncbi:MAG: Gfo/Idh/MocA family protein [Sphingobacterium sp.]